MAAERVEFGLPVQALQGAPESGDRFVYSYRFATLNNIGSNGRPVLTLSQWLHLAAVANFEGNPLSAWMAWHGGDATAKPPAPQPQAAGPQVSGQPVSEGEATMRFRLDEGRGRLYSGASYPSRTQSATHFPITSSQPGSEPDPLDQMLKPSTTDVLAELARSEIGVLFLDRTRLRPNGFVVGEHLHTLGLAAAEEVVLEQRSFIQSETTDETTDENEGTNEDETNKTWSKDVSEVITGTEATTRTDGFNAGGGVGFEYGVRVNLSAGENDTTSTADNDSRTNSVKEINSNTSKNVAKLRSLHKTVFRISATDRFERSARRTIRNPNAHTPIDLHFYKVLQRIRFSQERYGVRLCWTPYLQDPAGDFFGAEEKMRTELLRRARASVPSPSYPSHPVAAGVPGAEVVGLNPPLSELTSWYRTGAFGSSMNADYNIPINIKPNMKWDGDWAFVRDSLRHELTGHPRNYIVRIVGNPWEVVNEQGDRTLFQKIHAETGWNAYNSQIYISLSARIIPNANSLEGEQARLTAEWEAACATITAEYNAKVAAAEAVALAEFEAWRTEHRANFDPKQELMRRFITQSFLVDDRDSVAELDVWEQVFDWSLMSAKLYAGTWNGDGQLRDPSRPATDFVNASWARLYLPIRPGFEQMALRWMHMRDKVKTGPRSIEEFIAKLLKELHEWRVRNLGGPEEVVVTPVPGQACPDVVQKYICLGTWFEDLPTDGVHTEVTIAKTTAADPLTEANGKAESDRLAAVASALVAEGKVQEAIAGAGLNGVNVNVNIGESD